MRTYAEGDRVTIRRHARGPEEATVESVRQDGKLVLAVDQPDGKDPLTLVRSPAFVTPLVED